MVLFSLVHALLLTTIVIIPEARGAYNATWRNSSTSSIEFSTSSSPVSTDTSDLVSSNAETEARATGPSSSISTDLLAQSDSVTESSTTSSVESSEFSPSSNQSSTPSMVTSSSISTDLLAQSDSATESSTTSSVESSEFSPSSNQSGTPSTVTSSSISTDLLAQSDSATESSTTSSVESSGFSLSSNQSGTPSIVTPSSISNDSSDAARPNHITAPPFPTLSASNVAESIANSVNGTITPSPVPTGEAYVVNSTTHPSNYSMTSGLPLYLTTYIDDDNNQTLTQCPYTKYHNARAQRMRNQTCCSYYNPDLDTAAFRSWISADNADPSPSLDAKYGCCGRCAIRAQSIQVYFWPNGGQLTRCVTGTTTYVVTYTENYTDITSTTHTHTLSATKMVDQAHGCGMNNSAYTPLSVVVDGYTLTSPTPYIRFTSVRAYNYCGSVSDDLHTDTDDFLAPVTAPIKTFVSVGPDGPEYAVLNWTEYAACTDCQPIVSHQHVKYGNNRYGQRAHYLCDDVGYGYLDPPIALTTAGGLDDPASTPPAVGGTRPPIPVETGKPGPGADPKPGPGPAPDNESGGGQDPPKSLSDPDISPLDPGNRPPAAQGPPKEKPQPPAGQAPPGNQGPPGKGQQEHQVAGQPQPGQAPGQAPGQGSGQAQSGQAPGQAPGQGSGQAQSGQAPGQAPGQGSGQAQSGQAPGQAPSQGSGYTPGVIPGYTPGIGQAPTNAPNYGPPQPGPTPPAGPAITIAGSTYVPNAVSNYIIGSQTLVPGGAPITVAGTPVYLAPSASALVVAGQTQNLPPPAAAPYVPSNPITVGPQILNPLPNGQQGYLIGSQTLLPGAGPIVVAGTTLSLDPVGAALILDGGSTLALPSPVGGGAANSPANFLIVGSQTFTRNAAGQFVYETQTLNPGGSALTVDGTAVSLLPGATGVVIGSNTLNLNPSGGISPSSIVVGSKTLTTNAAGQFVVGSQTLTPGGLALTIDGTAVSLLPGATGVVIGSNTLNLNPSGGISPSSIVVGSKTLTANAAGQFVVGSHILTPGGLALTIDDTVVSLLPGATAVVVGSNTYTLNPSGGTSPSTIVIGSQIFTFNAAGQFVFGSQTLVAGGPAVTLDGHVVSIPPGGAGIVVVDGKTLTVGHGGAGTGGITTALGELIMVGLEGTPEVATGVSATTTQAGDGHSGQEKEGDSDTAGGKGPEETAGPTKGGAGRSRGGVGGMMMMMMMTVAGVLAQL